MSINRVLNEGFNLRAVPVHLACCSDAFDVIEAINKSQDVKEVVLQGGSACKYAVRAKVDM